MKSCPALSVSEDRKGKKRVGGKREEKYNSHNRRDQICELGEEFITNKIPNWDSERK